MLTVSCDLEIRIQAGLNRYGRLVALVLPGNRLITGSFVDQDGEDQRWLAPAMERALAEACDAIGFDVDLQLQQLGFHAVDSDERTFALLVQGAVRLASREGLAGTTEPTDGWEPPPWFHVRSLARIAD